MTYLKIKKNRGNYEVNVFHSRKSKSQYTNILNKDPNQIAQVLIDLIVQGFPIQEAIQIVNERIRRKDWMGI